MLPDIKKLAAAEQVAQKMQVSLGQPYQIDGHAMLALPSIGISIFPDDHHDEEVLLKQADTAMYEAKQRRNGAYRFFHELRRTDS